MSTEKNAKLKKDVELRTHQEDAVQFTEENDGRSLLAHGTGSGKTLSGLAAFEKLRDLNKATRALVLTPASLQSNFEQEGVRKFTTSTVGDVDGKSTYQIMSLAKFRRAPTRYLMESKADTVIVDEIHRAKDPSSVTYKALRTAAHSPQVSNFIGLTGSMVSNHPKDIVPLMDLVDPTHDLGSQVGFQKRHTKRKQYDRGGFLRGPKYRTELQRERALGGKLKGRLHYLGHEDISGDMPSMDVEDVRVPMSDEQNKAYQFALGRLSARQRRLIREGMPASQSEAQHILAAITKARQAANSIGTHVDMPAHESAERTPKLKRVMDDVEQHLRDTEDGQAVVYSNMVRGGAEELFQGLKRRGHDVGLFTGTGTLGVTKDSRDQDVRDFKAGKKKIIVLTPAAKEGVSLNNATFFAEVDRHYNPERNQQAIARGRRLGGLAHRDKKDRTLTVKRYYSEPKTSFFRRLIGQKEVGVDEWIGVVAKEKDRLNEDLRKTVKEASPAYRKRMIEHLERAIPGFRREAKNVLRVGHERPDSALLQRAKELGATLEERFPAYKLTPESRTIDSLRNIREDNARTLDRALRKSTHPNLSAADRYTLHRDLWSGRHAPQKGEVLLPASHSAENVVSSPSEKHLFRGNPFSREILEDPRALPEELVGLTSRHPDVAAGYAAGTSDFQHGGPATNRLFAYSRKDTPILGEGTADFYSMHGSAVPKADRAPARGFFGGPGGLIHPKIRDALQKRMGEISERSLPTRTLAQRSEAQRGLNTPTYEAAVDMSKLPSPVGEYSVRKSRTPAGQPAYAVRTVKGVPAEAAFAGTKKEAKVMYHGSPHELDEIRPGENGKIFLSPLPGVASLFTVPTHELPGLNQYRSHYDRYDEWNRPEAELQEILRSVGIRHNAPEEGPREGTHKGYVHQVEVDPALLQQYKDSDMSREVYLSGVGALPVQERVPVELQWTTRFDPEMEKEYGPAVKKEAAGKVWQVLRDAPTDKAARILEQLWHSTGTAAPRDVAKRLATEPGVREKWIKSLRQRMRTPELSTLERSDPLYLQSLRDLRSGNVRTLETGLDKTHVPGIMQHGPHTVGGGDLGENVMSDSLWDRGLASGSRIQRRNMTKGIYAHGEGTPRTESYAYRAGGEQPAILRYDLPKALVGPSGGKEYNIPRKMFQQFSRNHQVEDLTTGTTEAVRSINLPQIKKEAGSALRSRVSVKQTSPFTFKMFLGKNPDAIGSMDVFDGQVGRSFIAPHLRGLGLGSKMYGEVMRKMPNQTLSSSSAISDKAKAVWNKMTNAKGYKRELIPGGGNFLELAEEVGEDVAEEIAKPFARASLPALAKKANLGAFTHGAATAGGGSFLSKAFNRMGRSTNKYLRRGSQAVADYARGYTDYLHKVGPTKDMQWWGVLGGVNEPARVGLSAAYYGSMPLTRRIVRGVKDSFSGFHDKLFQARQAQRLGKGTTMSTAPTPITPSIRNASYQTSKLAGMQDTTHYLMQKEGVNLEDLRKAHKAMSTTIPTVRRTVNTVRNDPFMRLPGEYGAPLLKRRHVEDFGKHLPMAALTPSAREVARPEHAARLIEDASKQYGDVGARQAKKGLDSFTPGTVYMDGDQASSPFFRSLNRRHQYGRYRGQMKPESREALNRTVFLHEALETQPKGKGAFRFSSHNSLQPMLQDLNIAATLEGKNTGHAAAAVRALHKQDLDHLARNHLPEVQRLDLGNERISRHARKRLQQLYDKRLTDAVAGGTPMNVGLHHPRYNVVVNDYDMYDALRRERFPTRTERVQDFLGNAWSGLKRRLGMSKQSAAYTATDFLCKEGVGLPELRKAYQATTKKFPHVRKSIDTMTNRPANFKSTEHASMATAIPKKDPAQDLRIIQDAELVGGPFGPSVARNVHQELEKLPSAKRPTIFQQGDMATRMRAEAGASDPKMNPRSREALNRSIALHEGNELSNTHGVFRFASHNSLQPMLQDLNIAATMRGKDLQPAANVIRKLRGEEIEALSEMMPSSIGRLDLGKERLSRHARKRLQGIYDRKIVEEIGPRSTPLKEFQRTFSYPKYDRMRAEMYPDAYSLGELHTMKVPEGTSLYHQLKKQANPLLLQVASMSKFQPQMAEAAGNMFSNAPMMNPMMVGQALSEQVTDAMGSLPQHARMMVMQNLMRSGMGGAGGGMDMGPGGPAMMPIPKYAAISDAAFNSLFVAAPAIAGATGLAKSTGQSLGEAAGTGVGALGGSGLGALLGLMGGAALHRLTGLKANPGGLALSSGGGAAGAGLGAYLGGKGGRRVAHFLGAEDTREKEATAYLMSKHAALNKEWLKLTRQFGADTNNARILSGLRNQATQRNILQEPKVMERLYPRGMTVDRAKHYGTPTRADVSAVTQSLDAFTRSPQYKRMLELEPQVQAELGLTPEGFENLKRRTMFSGYLRNNRATEALGMDKLRFQKALQGDPEYPIQMEQFQRWGKEGTTVSGEAAKRTLRDLRSVDHGLPRDLQVSPYPQPTRFTTPELARDYKARGIFHKPNYEKTSAPRWVKELRNLSRGRKVQEAEQLAKAAARGPYITAILTKAAYGPKGHDVLQGAYNEAFGAGGDVERLMRVGNRMVDGRAGGLVDRVVDNVVTGPLNPVNANYHSFVDKGTTAPADRTRELIRNQRDKAVHHLVAAGEAAQRPTKGLLGPVKGWVNDKMSKLHTARGALSTGMFRHLQDDYVPHATRVQNVLETSARQAQTAQTAQNAVSRARARAVKKMLEHYDEVSEYLPSRIRRSADAAIAHASPTVRETIDAVSTITPGELRSAANQAKKVKGMATSALSSRLGGTAEEAEQVLQSLLNQPIGKGTETVAKLMHRGGVLKDRVLSFLRR